MSNKEPNQPKAGLKSPGEMERLADEKNRKRCEHVAGAVAGAVEVSPEMMAAHLAQLAAQRKVTMAQAIVLALLRNPSVHTYLGGSPLGPLRRGDVGDHDTVGGYLAAESLRLADDYCDALDKLIARRRPDVPTAEPSAP